MKFKDLDIGDKFSFLKIKGEYCLQKNSNIGWIVLSSNCKTYKVGQFIVAEEDVIVRNLFAAKVEKL